jgi:tripartite-type tricarboxylate transporter receptor subunit TctC
LIQRRHILRLAGVGAAGMPGANELVNARPDGYTGIGIKPVSDSPFGVCGPKGMDPAVTARRHDAFRKTLDDPAVLGVFDPYDQSVICMNTDTYSRFARDTFAAEKATIDRLGMAGK